tara:strand:- start:585 stop:821 length:237 start_codon:yes stop_codon:yes gene_type:complete
MSSAAVERPMYLFKSPSFDTHIECQEYVNVMYMKIYQKASASYNFKYTPEAIYCIDTEQVKDIFKYNYGKQETKKQKI